MRSPYTAAGIAPPSKAYPSRPPPSFDVDGLHHPPTNAGAAQVDANTNAYSISTQTQISGVNRDSMLYDDRSSALAASQPQSNVSGPENSTESRPGPSMELN